MDLQSFINKWTGKKVDYDSVYGNQCTDLTKEWLSSLGYSVTGAWGNAKDWDKDARANLNWIANTPSGVPKPGDIIVFGGGTYGHVSIFIDGNSTSFRSFDQNWPSGKGEACAIATHKYTGTLFVKGWLHPTVLDAPLPPVVDPKDELITSLRDKLTLCENKPPVEKIVYVDKPVEVIKEVPVIQYIDQEKIVLREPTLGEIITMIWDKIKNIRLK